MPSEIKFSSFGIPYLVEFANISIRTPSLKNKAKSPTKTKTKDKPKKLPPPPVRCPTCGHLPAHTVVPEVDTAAQENNENDAGQRLGGLYIRFQAQDSGAPPRKISDSRLARLRWKIANAVTQAGMTTPEAEQGELPAGASLSADGHSSIRSTSTSSTKSRALFKGTYGQVKEALRNAGLTATPCDEQGFEHATRLGALFVVNSKTSTSDGVELTKLTLWG